MHNCYNMLNFCLNLLFINYKSNQLLLLGQCLRLCLLLRLLSLLLSVFSWAALASQPLSLPLHNNAPMSVWSCWALSFISYAPLLYSLIIFFRLFVIVSFGDMHRHTHTFIHAPTNSPYALCIEAGWLSVRPKGGSYITHT